MEHDRWGTPVACAEDVWQRHAAKRAELLTHEAAIRETIRDPDALFRDRRSTTERFVAHLPDRIVIMHYVARGRTHGRQAGNFVSVVVKWVLDSADEATVRGYVQTMYLPDRILPRLEFVWSRPQ